MFLIITELFRVYKYVVVHIILLVIMISTRMADDYLIFVRYVLCNYCIAEHNMSHITNSFYFFQNDLFDMIFYYFYRRQYTTSVHSSKELRCCWNKEWNNLSYGMSVVLPDRRCILQCLRMLKIYLHKILNYDVFIVLLYAII